MKQTLKREATEVKMGNRTFWITADPILNASGDYIGAVHILSDITSRKQIEDERDMLRERLRQSQKLEAIGSLAGGIAHDFNNLLTPIIGYAEILDHKLTDEDMKKKVRAITKAGLSARQMTGQLLAFSRKQVMEMKVCDLNEVIEGFLDIMRRIIRENIEMEVRLAPCRLRVMADKGQLMQILLNLVINAQDSIEATGTIGIETSEILMDGENALLHPGMSPGLYALLAVSDSGCGMDEETLSHLFEPFFTTKEVGQGTGLGLATVYGIVKQHQAFIAVDSSPGRGSVFKIYLPLHTLEEDGKDEAVSPSFRGLEKNSGTILVVEDNSMVSDMVSQTLKEAGYRVHVAPLPVKALEIAEGLAEPFLLLTDIIMPGMSGNELFERLKSMYPELKVIYMSGYPGSITDHIDFLQKPFTAQALLERVQKML